MAEDWGVPPWVVMDQPGGALWAGRWKVYRDALHDINKAKEKLPH